MAGDEDKQIKDDHAKRVGRQVRQYVKDDNKLIAAVANSTTKKRRSPRARAMASGNKKALEASVFQMIIQRLSDKQKEGLIDVICNRWKYCETRSSQAEIESGVYAILIWVKPISVPICCWVFLIKYRLLDELCSCEDRNVPLSIGRWLKLGKSTRTVP